MSSTFSQCGYVCAALVLADLHPPVAHHRHSNRTSRSNRVSIYKLRAYILRVLDSFPPPIRPPVLIRLDLSVVYHLALTLPPTVNQTLQRHVERRFGYSDTAIEAVFL